MSADAGAAKPEAAASKPRFSTQARVWAGTLFGIASVVVGAVLLLVVLRAKREAELETYYSRAASHIARQIEARYQNLRGVLDVVTPVQASALTALELRGRAKELEERWKEAQRAAQATETQLATAGGLWDQSKKRAEKAQQDLAAARTLLELLNDRELVAQLERALETADTAKQELDAASEEFDIASALFRSRSAEAQRAAQAAAPGTAQTTQAPGGAKEVGTTQSTPTPRTSGDASNLDAATSDSQGVTPIDAGAASALAAAQNRLSDATHGLEEAQSRHREAVDAAHVTLAEVKAVKLARERVRGAANDAREKAAAAEAKRQRDAAALEMKSVEFSTQAQLLQQSTKAAIKAAGESIDAYERATRASLPSYAELIRTCIREGVNDDLCVAREIARDSDANRDLEIIACPAGVTVASGAVFMSHDRSAIVLRASGRDGGRPLCGRVELSKLMIPSQDGGDFGWRFGDVLLIDGSGTVLHPVGADSPGIQKLSDVDTKRSGSPHLQRNLLVGAERYAAFFAPTKLVSAGTCKTESCATLEDSKTQSAAGIHVAFMVNELRLKAQKVRIRSGWFLWVLVAVALCVFALPLGKLWFAGPHARFRRFDVWMLATSAVTATFLATALFCSAISHNLLSNRLQYRMGLVADGIGMRLSREVAAAGRSLQTFARVVVKDDSPGGCVDWPVSNTERAQVCEHTLVNPDFVGPSAMVSTANHEGAAEGKKSQSLPGSVGGAWRLAFLADDRGFQIEKFVPGEHATPPVQVAHRKYFKLSMSGEERLLEPQSEDDRGNNRGVPEVVRSITTGKIVLVVAKRVSRVWREDIGAWVNGVAAVEHELGSFQTPVLPLGFQMVVTDSNGQIMLHSNNDAHHGQSLYDAIERPTELKALMAARASSELSFKYFGVPTQALVRYLPGPGWFVTVMAPSALVETQTLNTVALASAAFLLLCVVMFIVLIVGSGLRRLVGLISKAPKGTPLYPGFLRPRSDLAVRYAISGVGMLVATVLLTAIATLTAVDAVAALPALLSILWIAATWRLKLPSDRKTSDSDDPERASLLTVLRRFTSRWVRPGLPLSVSLHYFGLAAAFIVLPAVVLVSASQEHVFNNLLRAEQNHFVHAREHHPECQADCGPCDSDFVPDFSAWTNDCRHQGMGVDVAPSSNPLHMVSDILPIIGDPSGDQAGRMYKAADFQRVGSLLSHTFPVRQPPMTISSVVPSLMSPDYHWFGLAAVVLGFVLFLGLVYTISFFNLKRLFFLDLIESWPDKEPSVEELFADAAANQKCRWLIVNPSEELLNELPRRVPEGPLLATPDGKGWLIDDAHAAFASQDALDEFQIVNESAQGIVLFSVGDPLRAVPLPMLKDALAILNEFKQVRCPPRPPVFKPDAVPTRVAMLHEWASSDQAEQEALARLAVDGFANPHPANVATLQHLVERGLVHPHTLTIANQHFRDFISSQVTPEHWNAFRGDEASVWSVIRVPLTTAVVTLCVVVASSRPELAAVGALVPTVAATMPHALKFLSSLAP